MKKTTRSVLCLLVCLLSVALLAVSFWGAARGSSPAVGNMPSGDMPNEIGGRGDGAPSAPPSSEPTPDDEEITDGEIEIGGAEPSLPSGGEGGLGDRGFGDPSEGRRGQGTALLPVLGGAVGGALLSLSLTLLCLPSFLKRKSGTENAGYDGKDQREKR